MALGEEFIGICHSNGSCSDVRVKDSLFLKGNIENYRQRKLLIEHRIYLFKQNYSKIVYNEKKLKV